MIKLNNDIINLRKPEPEDLEFLYKIENNTEFWNVSNLKAPLTKWLIKQHIENSSYDIHTNKELRLIIELNSNHQQVGIIDLYDFNAHDTNAGVGIIIDKQFQNKSYASMSLGLVIRYSFKHLLLHQLYCNIDIDNKESIKLFENNGFVCTGKFKDWKKTYNGFSDVLLYQLINNNPL